MFILATCGGGLSLVAAGDGHGAVPISPDDGGRRPLQAEPVPTVFGPSARRRLDNFLSLCILSHEGCTYDLVADSIQSEPVNGADMRERIFDWHSISHLDADESLVPMLRERLDALGMQLGDDHIRTMAHRALDVFQRHPFVLAREFASLPDAPETRAHWLGRKWQEAFLDERQGGLLSGLMAIAGMRIQRWRMVLNDESGNLPNELWVSLEPLRPLAALFKSMGSMSVLGLENVIRNCLAGGRDWFRVVVEFLGPDNEFGNSIPELETWFRTNYPNGYPEGITGPVESGQPEAVAGLG